MLILNADGTFSSPIRPNEKLQLGKVYTDTFEYVDYNDEGDDVSIFVEKNKIRIALIANELDGKLNDWARGDLYHIEWTIDTMRPAGDESQLWVKYFTGKTTKIKDGKVSLFRKKHTKPLKYIYFNANGYSDFTLNWIYRNVEYYLANSRQEAIVALLNDPTADISYSIEQDLTKEVIFRANIFNHFENNGTVIQSIYFNEEAVFEYDLLNDELIEFKE